MERILNGIAAAVERRPRMMLVVLAVATIVLGFFAAQQTTDTEMTAFAPDSELVRQYDFVQEEFTGSGGTIQVIVDAGPNGDVLSPEGLEVASSVEETALTNPGLVSVLAEPTAQMPAVVTYATPLQVVLAQQGLDITALDGAALDGAAVPLLDDAEFGPQVGALFSSDLEAATATAQGGLVVLRIDPLADAGEVSRAALAFRDALETQDYGSFNVSPFSEAIMNDGLAAAMNSEMPPLLGLSLLLIVGILYITFRRLSDVLLGFVGLVVTIVWMYGLAVVLGPDYLGVTGPLSQIAIVIPVLLVGLGIDYAIHLTSRYREEQNSGVSPRRSAGIAISTVGGALVLATATTMLGFLTNLVSPLPPVADFGIFTAAGVLAAFIVMTTLVPASRALLDLRTERHGRMPTARTGESRGLARVMARVAVLAEHAPRTTLASAVVVALVASIAASQVSTTFSQDEFIPEDSEIGMVLDDIQTLFGGDLSERTYVLVEGNLATPDAANALATTQAQLAGIEDIRTIAGTAQAESAVAVVSNLGADSAMTEQLVSLGWDGTAFASDADVAAIYELARSVVPEAMASVLQPDNRIGVISIQTTAGQDRASQLVSSIEGAATPLSDAGLSASVVSEGLVLNETLDELTASQIRSIVFTLIAALILLTIFFWIRERRPFLGLVTMVPSALVVPVVLGTMWALGLSLNILTATVASLAIGIGVPFGIHVTHRFLEELNGHDSVDEAIAGTVSHTGGALLGSAATTAAGFGVLGLASMSMIQQFGLITALTIVISLSGAVLVQPAALKLWADARLRKDMQAGSSDEDLDDDKVLVGA